MDYKNPNISRGGRLYLQARIWLYSLLSNMAVSGKPYIIHPCIFTGAGKLVCGQHVKLGVWPSPHYWSGNSHFDTRSENALIEIGNNVTINNNFTAICLDKIIIGAETLIGINVSIMDFDAHGVQPNSRRGNKGKSGQVTIGRNCWIGSNVSILKGVSIGDNSVIGLGSVVVDSIPANVVAAGNPCKVVREISID